MSKLSKDDRKWLRIFKYVLCRFHQPFVKMEKSPKFFGWICPECGNIMDEMVREYRLNKFRREMGKMTESC